MTYDKNFMLADFGKLKRINNFSEGDEGAGPYVSPEALTFPYGKYAVTSATDIFGFGVVLMEAALGKNAPRRGFKGYLRLRNGEIGHGSGIYKINCS